jgi:hypothetical protein
MSRGLFHLEYDGGVKRRRKAILRWTITGLAPLLLIIALWVEVGEVSWASPGRSFELYLGHGSFRLCVPAYTVAGWMFSPVGTYIPLVTGNDHCWWFHHRSWTFYSPYGASTGSEWIVPIWPFAVGAIAASAYFWIRRGRPRIGACVACGYDRRGLEVDAACPECGSKP